MSLLEPKSIPRVWRLPLANICRRSSRIHLGLKLLTPVVLESSRQNGPPLPLEKAEYAALLQRFGAIDEALSLLSTIDGDALPVTHLFTAFCLFNLWDYQRAIPHLEKYQHSLPGAYQELTVQVNLGAAHLALGALPKAKALLESTLGTAEQGEHRRLQANCHELLAQVEIFAGNLEAAAFHLLKIRSLLDDGKNVDLLLAKKCEAFLEAKRTESILPLDRFRPEAASWPHAETLRELDLFSVIVKYDAALLNKLYFGTPYLPYRRRIESLTGKGLFESTYLIGEEQAEIFDLTSGLYRGETKITPGSLPHQLLKVLLRDQYRPVRIGGIFNALFPQERFDIYNSPIRVHQLLTRSRRILKRTGIAIEFTSSTAGYQAHVGAGLAVRITQNLTPSNPVEASLQALQFSFESPQTFTATQAQETLNVSKAVIRRILALGCEQGRIEKYGSGPATTYYFLESGPKPA